MMIAPLQIQHHVSQHKNVELRKYWIPTAAHSSFLFVNKLGMEWSVLGGVVFHFG